MFSKIYHGPQTFIMKRQETGSLEFSLAGPFLRTSVGHDMSWHFIMCKHQTATPSQSDLKPQIVNSGMTWNTHEIPGALNMHQHVHHWLVTLRFHSRVLGCLGLPACGSILWVVDPLHQFPSYPINWAEQEVVKKFLAEVGPGRDARIGSQLGQAKLF